MLAAEGFGARAAEAHASAVTWRWSDTESGAHRPEPFAAQRHGGEGGWRAAPPQYGPAERVGFDAAGRPTVVVSWFEGREGEVVEVWEHAADRSTGLRRLDDTEGAEPRAWVTLLDDFDRPTVVVSAHEGSAWVDDEPLVEVAIEQWTWEDGRVARGEVRPSAAVGEWAGATGGMVFAAFDDDEGHDGAPAVVEPTYGEHGELIQLFADGRPLLGEAADEWFDDLFGQAPDAAEEDGSSVSGDAIPADASTSRDVLTTALLAHGVAEAKAIVCEHAAAVLRLEVRDGSDGAPLPRSRLYGRGALLPPGTPWPHADNGRALGFLAAIDLSELPRDIVGTPSPLPAAGWLLFFADLDTAEDGGRNWEQGTFLGEGYPNAEGEPSRVFWVPAGVEPVEAEPPPLRVRSDALAERRCAAVPQLQLPTGWDARALFTLPRAQQAAYDEVAYALSPWPSDFVLGDASGAETLNPDEPDSAVLIHLGSAEFQDGGGVQFRLPAAALAAGDWSRVRGYGESC